MEKIISEIHKEPVTLDCLWAALNFLSHLYCIEVEKVLRESNAGHLNSIPKALPLQSPPQLIFIASCPNSKLTRFKSTYDRVPFYGSKIIQADAQRSVIWRMITTITSNYNQFSRKSGATEVKNFGNFWIVPNITWHLLLFALKPASKAGANLLELNSPDRIHR